MQEDREKKKADQAERKKDLQRLADEEMEAIKPTLGASKLTRAEIDARMRDAEAAGHRGGVGSNVVVVDELPLEENVNRLSVDGLEARSVDQAIKILR